ncbi:hypothetical protein VP01_1456g3 [Puccinia sorghi]|uniref:Uncharacterized protein n=1 Tax=Puccinia sorghi TaxID=27349 RepID=A0A0L6VK42_9BASI|nr:hypothetical protein VP01_1456g3 [Puccinia sorghi]
MGKSAKSYKRPSRKEKMGLSASTSCLRAAIPTGKLNKPQPNTLLPTHQPPPPPKPDSTSLPQPNHSLPLPSKKPRKKFVDRRSK